MEKDKTKTQEFPVEQGALLDDEKELEKEASLEGDAAIIKFSRPYDFEGEKISQIDLSGLDNLTAADMSRVTKMVINGGVVLSSAVETTMPYALAMASIASKRPIEFFNRLRPRDAIKVKAKVQAFLFFED